MKFCKKTEKKPLGLNISAEPTTAAIDPVDFHFY